MLMRYLPMIFAAGLLSAGFNAASAGPADAAMPTIALDRSAIADTLVEKAGYYYRRRHYGYRPYYGGYGTGGRITAMATDGPTMVMVMDMGVAGATKRGPAKNIDF